MNTIRVYEHDGVLHIRDGQKQARIQLDPERIPQARQMLRRLDKQGRLRFITLRTILEEH